MDRQKETFACVWVMTVYSEWSGIRHIIDTKLICALNTVAKLFIIFITNINLTLCCFNVILNPYSNRKRRSIILHFQELTWKIKKITLAKRLTLSEGHVKDRQQCCSYCRICFISQLILIKMLFREWPRVVTDYGLLSLGCERSNRKIKLNSPSPPPAESFVHVLDTYGCMYVLCTYIHMYFSSGIRITVRLCREQFRVTRPAQRRVPRNRHEYLYIVNIIIRCQLLVFTRNNIRSFPVLNSKVTNVNM